MRIVLKPMGAFTLLVAFAILALVATLHSQPVATLTSISVIATMPTSGPDALLHGDALSWNLVRQSESAAQIAYPSPPDLPAGAARPAISITVVKPTPAQFWLTQIARTVYVPLKTGRRLQLHFWARSRTASPMFAVVERFGPPWEKDLNEKVALTPDWKEYTFGCRVTSDRESGKTHVCFQLGETAGHIDIADIDLR